MAFTADFAQYKFPALASAFAGKRVLITGSGKDGGIGQALAMAAAANGAAAVGVHFHSSYRDGFDLVDAILGEAGKFAADVLAGHRDLDSTFHQAKPHRDVILGDLGCPAGRFGQAGFGYDHPIWIRVGQELPVIRKRAFDQPQGEGTSPR